MKKLFFFVLIVSLGQLTTYAESAEIEIDSVTISLGELQCDIFLLDHITGEDCVREWLKGELPYGFPYLYVFILVEYNNIPDNFPAFPPCVDNSILSMDDLEVTNGVVTGVYGEDTVSTYGGFRYDDILDYQMIVEVIDPTIPVTVTLKADSFWSGCANAFHPSATATWNPPTLDLTPDPTPDPDPEPVESPIEFADIVISEIMFETRGDIEKYPQWIELYNNTDSDVNLKGYELIFTVSSMTIDSDFIVKANSTCLIVSSAARHSKNIVSDILYSRDNTLFAKEHLNSFQIALIDPNGNTVDNVSSFKLHDSIIENENGTRSSIIRKFDSDQEPLKGNKKTSWMRAYNTKNIANSDYFYGHTSDIGTPGYRNNRKPLPVELSIFSARVIEGKVVINWVTESELDNAGFNILRSQTKQGPFVQVNRKLIQGAGTTGERSTYTWMDTTANRNTAYYYRLEDISFAGTKQVVATKLMRGILTAKNRLTTQWGKLKAR